MMCVSYAGLFGQPSSTGEPPKNLRGFAKVSLNPGQTQRATVTLDGSEFEIGKGHYVDVPRGTAHRLENRRDEPLVIIEVQYGDYFGEDDIIRLSDDYGRADASEPQ